MHRRHELIMPKIKKNSYFCGGVTIVSFLFSVKCLEKHWIFTNKFFFFLIYKVGREKNKLFIVKRNLAYDINLSIVNSLDSWRKTKYVFLKPTLLYSFAQCAFHKWWRRNNLYSSQPESLSTVIKPRSKEAEQCFACKPSRSLKIV